MIGIGVFWNIAQMIWGKNIQEINKIRPTRPNVIFKNLKNGDLTKLLPALTATHPRSLDFNVQFRKTRTTLNSRDRSFTCESKKPPTTGIRWHARNSLFRATIFLLNNSFTREKRQVLRCALWIEGLHKSPLSGHPTYHHHKISLLSAFSIGLIY